MTMALVSTNAIYKCIDMKEFYFSASMLTDWTCTAPLLVMLPFTFT